MSVDVNQLFAGMAAAQRNGKGNYMGEGVFVVETKTLKIKDGFRGKSFICEFTILETNNAAHPVGSTASWVVKLDKPQAWGDLKDLVFALMGHDPATVAPPERDPELHAQATELAKIAVSPDYAVSKGAEANAFNGILLRLETNKIKTQKGGDFTIHRWSPAEANVT